MDLLDSIQAKSLGEPLEFKKLHQLACRFSLLLLERKEALIEVLMQYETFEVAADEIRRTVDLFDNLDKNSEYFIGRTGSVKTFLPQNQPLYALACFGIVPSLMADKVFVRPPRVAHPVFRQLVEELELPRFFPNIELYYGDKQVFAAQDSKSTNVVIFTGKSETGLNLRKKFSEDTLFILNGSGHNPIVVTESADLDLAVENSLKVTLFNQGQDCSAPSAILVHQKIAEDFRHRILEKLREIDLKVGPYKEKKNIVGPNTNGKHVVKMAEFFRKNKDYFIWGGSIHPIFQMIQPTLFEKPLHLGPVFEEYFAPVIMLQPYDQDSGLGLYFEHPRYLQNSMYVTVFGYSPYVESLKAKGLHLDDNIIYNSNIQNIERGFLQYGGLGPRASCVYLGSKKYYGATLPQRDIFQYLLKPQAEGLRTDN